jgi:hypothetical protein
VDKSGFCARKEEELEEAGGWEEDFCGAGVRRGGCGCGFGSEVSESEFVGGAGAEVEDENDWGFGVGEGGCDAQYGEV